MSASHSDSWTEAEHETDFLARLNLPATIIQPPQVRDILYRQGVTDDRELKILVCTFFGIGSPEACSSLRKTLRILREHGPWRILPPASSTNDFQGTIRALMALECYERRNRLVQRQYLAKIRECYEQHLNERRSQQLSSVEASSCALEDTLMEVEPDSSPRSAEHQTRRDRLSDVLANGQNWYLLKRVFGEGIFALVPGEPEHGVEDEEIQGLPHAVFTKLLDLLNRHRGNFLRNASERLSAIYSVLSGQDTTTEYMFEENEESVLDKTFDALELVDKFLSVS